MKGLLRLLGSNGDLGVTADFSFSVFSSEASLLGWAEKPSINGPSAYMGSAGAAGSGNPLSVSFIFCDLGSVSDYSFLSSTITSLLGTLMRLAGASTGCLISAMCSGVSFSSRLD